MDPRDDIEDIARRHGAAMVGFDEAAPYGRWQEVALAREADGTFPPHFVARMTHDPATLLLGAASVVVCAIDCGGLAGGEKNDEPQVCAVIRKRIVDRPLCEAIAAYIEGAGYRVVLNPELPRREAAARAGLGWLGRNNMLITALGSSVRLVTLVTDMPLEPTGPPMQSRCGDCTLCIEACPAGALLGPYRYDCSRCLCYLSEYDVPVPEDLFGTFANHLLGCEECQRVCPHKRGLPALGWGRGTMLELATRALQDFDAVNAVFENDFAYPFKSRELLLRTLLIGLANAGATEALPVAVALSWDPHEPLALVAREAARRLRSAA